MAKIEGNGSCSWWRRGKHKMNSKEIHGVMICLESGRGSEHCSHRIKYLCILSGSLVSEWLLMSQSKQFLLHLPFYWTPYAIYLALFYLALYVFTFAYYSHLLQKDSIAQQGTWDMQSMCLGSYPGSDAHKLCVLSKLINHPVPQFPL